MPRKTRNGKKAERKALDVYCASMSRSTNWSLPGQGEAQRSSGVRAPWRAAGVSLSLGRTSTARAAAAQRGRATARRRRLARGRRVACAARGGSLPPRRAVVLRLRDTSRRWHRDLGRRRAGAAPPSRRGSAGRPSTDSCGSTALPIACTPNLDGSQRAGRHSSARSARVSRWLRRSRRATATGWPVYRKVPRRLIIEGSETAARGCHGVAEWRK